MLHTIPLGLLLIEYPFNMIPINVRLFPAICLIMLFYLVVSFVYSYAMNEPIILPLFWMNSGLDATLVYFAVFILDIVFIFLIWLVTEKFKLPYYRARYEKQTDYLISGLSDSLSA